MNNDYSKSERSFLSPRPTRSRKKIGCVKIGCGLFLLLFLAAAVFTIVGNIESYMQVKKWRKSMNFDYLHVKFFSEDTSYYPGSRGEAFIKKLLSQEQWALPPEKSVPGISFLSPDESLVAKFKYIRFSYGGGRVHVFQLNSGENIFESDPIGSFSGAAINSDNSRLLISYQWNLALFDLETSKTIWDHERGVYDVRPLCFSRDEEFFLADALYESVIQMWKTETCEEVCRVCYDYDSEEWAVVTPDGHYDGSKKMLETLRIKPAHMANEEENYYSPKDRPEWHVPGLLETFFRHGENAGETGKRAE